MRAAIEAAKNTTGDDLIVLREAVVKAGIKLDNTLIIDIDADQHGAVAIVAPVMTEIDGQNQVRVFDIAPGSDVYLGNLYILNGRASGPLRTDANGSGIRAINSVSRTAFRYNTMSFRGTSAAVYQEGGASLFTDVVFRDNHGYLNGAFDLNGGSSVQINVEYVFNKADYQSAAIGVGNSASLTLINAELTNNTSNGQGSANALGITNSTTEIFNSTIISNSSYGFGSGIGIMASTEFYRSRERAAQGRLRISGRHYGLQQFTSEFRE